jgi:hypothetical protein
MSSSRFTTGGDHTSTFHEKLLVRVLSFLDVFDLFVARMVCKRWQRICEHPDLYQNLDMQTFMMYNRYLSLPLLLLSHIHECCSPRTFLTSFVFSFILLIFYSTYKQNFVFIMAFPSISFLLLPVKKITADDLLQF